MKSRKKNLLIISGSGAQGGAERADDGGGAGGGAGGGGLSHADPIPDALHKVGRHRQKRQEVCLAGECGASCACPVLGYAMLC